METRYRLSRILRTLSSEVYVIWEAESRLGQVDFHFGSETIQATLILEHDLPLSEERELLALLEDDVASSHLNRYQRADYVVHVYGGHEINRYVETSDELHDIGDDEEDDDDDDEEVIGHEVDDLDGLFADDLEEDEDDDDEDGRSANDDRD